MNAGEADDLERALAMSVARERHAEEQVELLGRRLDAAERYGDRIAELELDLATTRARVHLLDEENHELRRVNAELGAAAEQLRSLNEGLEGSVSWRMTRPLRLAKDALRR